MHEAPVLERSSVKRSAPAIPKASEGTFQRYRVAAIVLIAALALIAVGASGFYIALRDQGAAIIASVPWADQYAVIIFDHHNHTNFSDGSLTPIELVDMAKSGGCDALAITDHSDTRGTASREQFDSIAQIRWRYPDFLLFGGIEINMPSYGQREHVNVIVDPSVEVEILPELRNAAEKDGATDEAFLRLAADVTAQVPQL